MAIHAYQPASAWLGMPYYDHAVEAALRRGEQLFEDLEGLADESAAEVRFELHEGPPAETLSRVAAIRDADEIIVGARTLDPVRAALGSVSRRLLRVADRPVLVVPGRAPVND